MNGLDCTREIRKLEAEGKLTGHVPIIAVTANARAEQVQTAMDAGMVSHPFVSHHRRVLHTLSHRLDMSSFAFWGETCSAFHRSKNPSYREPLLEQGKIGHHNPRLTGCLEQDGVIAKPFRIPDLIPKIEELMMRYPMPPAQPR